MKQGKKDKALSFVRHYTGANNFMHSLRIFYEDKGFLTEKQIIAAHKELKN